MSMPNLIINFKTYEQTIGNNAVEVARKIDALEDGRVALAVQTADISRISAAVKHAQVFAQHLDPVPFGKFTGSNHPKAIAEAGAVGTLLNHAEHQIPMELVQKGIEAANENGLIVCACADTPEKTKTIASFHPAMVAIEYPELIGSGVSISKVKPELITETVQLINASFDMPVLAGAGVSTKEDVQKAVALGVKGAILASAVTTSPHPEKVTRELLDGLD